MTDHNPSPSPAPAAPVSTSTRRRLGLPLVATIGLALLAAPRVILHDLGIIHEGTANNALFVFLPPIVWIIVVLVAKAPNPFVTILAIGVCYGIFLAVGHQLLWGIAFTDNPPRLGGNLAALDPAIQAVILRSFAALSSLITGAIAGAIAGLVAWGLAALARRSRLPR
ncbi:hypothetical protein ACXET9_15950 [Brachybacterium sp. DNPG3]